MAKTQNAKSLMRGNSEKAKFVKISANKVEKQISVLKPKAVKMQKSLGSGQVKKSLGKSSKNLNAVALEEIKKDSGVKNTYKKTIKPLVLAPANSTSQKQLSKAKKLLIIPFENEMKTKEELDTSIAEDTQEKVENKKSFDKTKVKSKTKGSAIKPNQLAKDKALEKVYEAIPVDEEAFNAIVCEANVLKVVNALKTLVEKEVATKKTSIFGDYNYCLNVSSFKIPSCPKRVYKLNLKYAMVDAASDDVLIVVPDLKRGAKVEFESTIEHYTNLFQDAGIHGLKIMPFNQLRNEYKAFEAKRKLASTYDFYICDGRIAGQVVGFCGKIFQKSRTTFHTVRMDNPKILKLEIEKALHRTAYKQLKKGDLISIPVGSDKLTATQVVENILQVITQLKDSYPGGLENIRGIDVKVNIRGTSSLPIYASTSSGPDVVPYVVGPREQRMMKLKKQTNETLSKFIMTKEADILQLSRDQIERKRKFKEFRTALITDQSKTNDPDKEEELSNEVPKKKPRKEIKLVEKKIKRKTTTKKGKST